MSGSANRQRQSLAFAATAVHDNLGRGTDGVWLCRRFVRRASESRRV
jgi:hypothetical protein